MSSEKNLALKDIILSKNKKFKKLNHKVSKNFISQLNFNIKRSDSISKTDFDYNSFKYGNERLFTNDIYKSESKVKNKVKNNDQ